MGDWIQSIKDKISSKISVLYLRAADFSKKVLKKIFHIITANIRIIISWSVFLALALMFLNKLAVFLAENTFIDHQDVKQQYFKSAYILLTAGISVHYLWLIIKNYRRSKKFNYIVFYISAIYIFLRFNSHGAVYFSHLSIRYNIYYADAVLLIGLLNLLLFVLNTVMHNAKLYDCIMHKFLILSSTELGEKASHLIEDVPSEGGNVSDNEKVIEGLFSAIANLVPSKSFVIGINSIWGAGKTSFLKRLEYKLDFCRQEGQFRPISFWFNAWQHQDEKSIINNFFSQLKKELGKFSGEAENSIDNYLKEMVALVDNKYLNFLNSLAGKFFYSSETGEDFYNDINKIIEKTNRKIIVFVDDIDRLNKNEILEVLRILRNIADFKNVIFICAFDREYVVKQSQIENNYLDKIFNLEISLSTQNQKSFMLFLNELIQHSSGYTATEKTKLTAAFNSIFYDDEIYENLNLKKFLGMEKTIPNDKELMQRELFPSYFFESKRDVKKFFNELYINIKILKNWEDVELGEYIVLKLLLFKYKWMHKNFSMKRIDLWLGEEERLKFKSKDLEKLYNHPDLENHDKVIIFSVLRHLFPDDNYPKASISITYRRFFPLYFTNNVFNDSFSFTQLYNAVEKLEVQQLINSLGTENKPSVINDIKILMCKPENIRNKQEYFQLINLIKNGTFGTLDEMEILRIVQIGETLFPEDFQNMSKDIFTNLTDDLGSFLSNLNSYYAKKPKGIDSGRAGDLIYDEEVDLKFLTAEKTVDILIELLEKEITVSHENPINILAYYKTFYSSYYPFFYFGVLSEEFKLRITQFLNDNFEAVFLENNSSALMEKIDMNLLANIFEDPQERINIIEQADSLLKDKTSWKDSDLKRMAYTKKGLDNFTVYFESKKESVSEINSSRFMELTGLFQRLQENGYAYFHF